MKPKIDRTMFGSVTVDGQTFERDIIIRLSGKVKKRRKKLSSAVYGTSHVISLEEAKHVYQKGAERLVVGAGQFGLVELSEEAAGYFDEQGCLVDLQPMKEALKVWNEAEGSVIGLFHVTC